MTIAVDLGRKATKQTNKNKTNTSYEFWCVMYTWWKSSWFLSSAVNLCKQFGPRSGMTECRSWSGSKLFDTLIVFLKEIFEKVYFEKSQQSTAKSWKITRHAELISSNNFIWFFQHPSDVDYKIMQTFVEFYATLLGFVNFKLYSSLNLHYPPKVRNSFCILWIVYWFVDLSSKV